METKSDRVLVVPGLDGHPGLLEAVAPRLFPDWEPIYFNHHADLAEDGVEGLAQRAAALIPGGARVYVAGESFGGTVALALAHLYPERVKGLILLSTFGRFPSPQALGARLALRLWRRIGTGWERPWLRAARVVGIPAQLGARLDRETLRTYLAYPLPEPRAYLRKCELSVEFDALPWLGQIACPTLVVLGTWDTVVPTSAGGLLGRTIPGSRIHRLPGGHAVHVAEPRRVGQLIEAWAKERPAA